jgi:large subunit ribosomal protein L32e
MSQDLIDLRNRINKKRRNFFKQGIHKKKRLEKKWKFPRGCDSKIAIERKGYCKRVKPGYRGPAEVRGLSRQGLNIVNVSNIKDIKNINKSEDIICIAHVGTRNKIEIVKECVKQGLKILNLKDPAKFLADVENFMKQKKQEKEQKAKTEKAAEKKKEDSKEGIEAKVDKEAEKKEKDKILTKREA